MLIATFIQYERGGFHTYVARSCGGDSEELDTETLMSLTDAITELLERYSAQTIPK